MDRIVKMKLEVIGEGQLEIEEMTVPMDDGRVLGMIPAFYNKESLLSTKKWTVKN